MPTEIAILSWRGTALKTASRKPVSTRIRMIRPSITTRPMASAQVIWLAIENVTKALSPSPAARASGKLATTPIRIVITPATSAVAAATAAKSPSRRAGSPSMSAPLEQDDRVEHDDVAHRQEGDDAAADLAARPSIRAAVILK